MIKKVGGLIAVLSILVIGVVVGSGSASAFNVSSATGGDGYTPIIHKMVGGETRIFTIYHHLKPSGTATPNYNINCVVQTTSSICAGYPKYFSSVAGTSNTGIDDISTSFYPHYATEGSKVYYDAQRTSDNGIGCFDLESGTNCGYTALGSLSISATATRPAMSDGVERVANRLYTFGKDVKAYCYDLTTGLACVGQPYNVGLGDATLPAFDGTDLRVATQTIGTNIYFAMNYWSQSTPADARLTCFDTLTNARCSTWSTAIDMVGTNTTSGGIKQGISSIFADYDAAGTATAVCTAGYGPDGATCWNLITQVSVATPPGLMIGLPASLAREETRLGNKSFFAFYQNPGGFAQCYDFTTQALCAGFVSPHTWASVNGGDTRDYGYTYSDAGCFFATGDMGVLWSFDPITGATGDTSCANVVIPQALPNTGAKDGPSAWIYLMLAAPIILAAWLVRRHAPTGRPQN
jgi:hypothetical protein